MDVEATFRAHGNRLFLYLARYCGDPQMAKDAVQETFIRFQRRPPRDEAAIPRWLFRTGTNLVRDMARVDANRRRILSAESHRFPSPRPAPNPERDLEKGEDLARLRAALAGLRDKERAALLMREAGFRHREIADELDTTTASVGTLVARALAKLESAMLDGEVKR